MQNDWDEFLATGKISDYLKYKGINLGYSKASKGDIKDADHNVGNSDS